MRFHIENMTCGGCARSVTRAVEAVDSKARVTLAGSADSIFTFFVTGSALYPLKSREEIDAFIAEHQAQTTPQTFIDGKRAGGYDELREYLGKAVKAPDTITYEPVIALFGMALAMAFAVSWAAYGNVTTIAAAEWFVAFAMCLLALQKLKDVDGFATMFLNYDLLAQRWVRYATIYPSQRRSRAYSWRLEA